MASSVIVNQAGVPLVQKRRIDTTALVRNAELMRQSQQMQQ
jgi:hypothetical protein